MPKIEILHSRDPDSSCEVTVFIDGVEATDYVQVDCDPGAGHEMSSWEENIADWQADPGLSPAFKELVVKTLSDASDSKYIEDEED